MKIWVGKVFVWSFELGSIRGFRMGINIEHVIDPFMFCGIGFDSLSLNMDVFSRVGN